MTKRFIRLTPWYKLDPQYPEGFDDGLWINPKYIMEIEPRVARFSDKVVFFTSIFFPTATLDGQTEVAVQETPQEILALIFDTQR